MVSGFVGAGLAGRRLTFPRRASTGGGRRCGGCGGLAVEEADDCLADERVTLNDMRN